MLATRKLGTDPPACCPDREYFQDVTSDSEVEPVLALAHEVATDLVWTASLNFLAQARVTDNDEQYALDVHPDRTRGGRSVLRPPRRSALDFTPRAGFDDVAEGHA